MLTENTQVGRKWVILGCILVVAMPYLCLVPYLRIAGFNSEHPAYGTISLVISRLLLWALLAGIYFYALRIEKSKFLLWEERKYPIGIYIAFSLVTFVAILFVTIIMGLVLRILHLDSQSEVLNKMTTLFKNQHWLIILTCVTAGFTEELMFRAYLQPRLEILFKNRWIAIAGSAFFFALIHFGFGTVQNILGPFVIGMIFAIHYSYFRNIRFLIVFHVLWDIMAIYLILFLKDQQQMLQQ